MYPCGEVFSPGSVLASEHLKDGVGEDIVTKILT